MIGSKVEVMNAVNDIISYLIRVISYHIGVISYHILVVSYHIIYVVIWCNSIDLSLVMSAMCEGKAFLSNRMQC